MTLHICLRLQSRYSFTTFSRKCTPSVTFCTHEVVVFRNTASCCTATPTVLTSTLTVTIGDTDTDDDEGCSGTADMVMRAVNVDFANIFTGFINDATLVNIDANADEELVTVAADAVGNRTDRLQPYSVCFFQLPGGCGSQKLTASSFTSVSASPSTTCTLANDGVLSLVPEFGANGTSDGDTLTCTVDGTLRGCNTLSTTFQLVFTLLFGNC